MYIKVYGDMMFIINVISLYVIYTMADCVNRCKSSVIKKLVLSCVMSGLYLIGVIIDLKLIINYSYIFTFIAVLIYSPFKLYYIAKNYVIINICSAVTYGFYKYFFREFNGFIFIVSIVITYIVLKLLSLCINFKRYYNISIYYKNRKIVFKALLDTGNLLSDPITGKPVIIVERKYIKNIEYDLIYRPIAYKSIGSEMGYLNAFYADYADINGKRIKKPTVAVYDTSLSDNNKYNAIIGLKHLGGI